LLNFALSVHKKMITILGPTASGKTKVAAALAADMDGVIISADSRQVYRGMDIGTGKDLEDYVVGEKQIDYRLIDIAEAGTKYNLFQYLQDFRKAYDDILASNKLPILCGGTGLYIEAVLKDYRLSPVPQNPTLRKQLEGKSLDELTLMLQELKAKNGAAMHNTTDVDTAQRAIRAIEIETYEAAHQVEKTQETSQAINALVVGINIDRDQRREKISQRLRTRLDNGMIDEVKALLDRGIAPEDLIYYGLEYKFVTQYLIGQLSYDEMFSGLEIAIHQFAKRQMTWFRGMERRGTTIHWIDANLPLREKIDQIKNLYDQ